MIVKTYAYVLAVHFDSEAGLRIGVLGSDLDLPANSRRGWRSGAKLAAELYTDHIAQGARVTARFAEFKRRYAVVHMTLPRRSP